MVGLGGWWLSWWLVVGGRKMAKMFAFLIRDLCSSALHKSLSGPLVRPGPGEAAHLQGRLGNEKTQVNLLVIFQKSFFLGGGGIV